MKLFCYYFHTGISTKDISEDSAPLMILEYMPFGDLHSFLSKHKYVLLGVDMNLSQHIVDLYSLCLSQTN